LFFLPGEKDAAARTDSLHLLGLVPDNHDQPLRAKALGRVQHMLDQGFASQVMENLCPGRAHPLSQTCRQNNNAQ
jgi:hypothetical protein